MANSYVNICVYMCMARTTLILRDELMDELRRLAKRERRTLTEQVDIVLSAGLERGKQYPSPLPMNLLVGEGGLQPGVNLAKMAELREHLAKIDGRS